ELVKWQGSGLREIAVGVPNQIAEAGFVARKVAKQRICQRDDITLRVFGKRETVDDSRRHDQQCRCTKPFPLGLRLHLAAPGENHEQLMQVAVRLRLHSPGLDPAPVGKGLHAGEALPGVRWWLAVKEESRNYSLRFSHGTKCPSRTRLRPWLAGRRWLQFSAHAYTGCDHWGGAGRA